MSKAQKTKDFTRFYDFRKDREKYPDAMQEYRFEPVDEEHPEESE